MDHPDLVRGVIMLAGAGRAIIPAHVRMAIMQSGDPQMSDAERVEALKIAFFAPGDDPVAAGWLKGWHPAIKKVQLGAESAPRTTSSSPRGARRSSTCRPSSTRWCRRRRVRI